MLSWEGRRSCTTMVSGCGLGRVGVVLGYGRILNWEGYGSCKTMVSVCDHVMLARCLLIQRTGRGANYYSNDELVW